MKYTENYYKVLGVSPNATEEEISRVYKLKAKEFHPDVSKMPNASEIFKKVNHARDILTDPLKRLEHDYAIGVKQRPGQHQQQDDNYQQYTQNQQRQQQSYYSQANYQHQHQPDPENSGKQFWFQVILLLILALIFGSSDKDKRNW